MRGNVIMVLAALIKEFNMYKPELGYDELLFSMVFFLNENGDIQYFVPDINTANSISPDIVFLVSYIKQVGKITKDEYIIPHSCFDFVLNKLKKLDCICYINPDNILSISPQYSSPDIRIKPVDDDNVLVEIDEGFEIISGRINNYTIYDNTLFLLPEDFPIDFFRQLGGKNKTIDKEILPSELENGYIPGLISKMRQREKNAKTIQLKPEITIEVCKTDNKNGILFKPYLKYGEYINVLIAGKYEYGENYTVFKNDSKYIIKRDMVTEILLRNRFKEQYPHLTCCDDGYLCSNIDSIRNLWDIFIPSLKKEYNLVFSDETLHSPVITNENINIGLQVSYNKDSGFFDFNIGFHCNQLKISLENLHKIVRREFGWLSSENTFIQIKNLPELESLFSYFENPSYKPKNENGNIQFHLKPAEAAVFSQTVSDYGNIDYSSDKFYKGLSTIMNSTDKYDFTNINDKLLPVLRNYQKDGVRWMSFLDYFRLGGILADDMGLGKTLQVLALLKICEREGTALIICPKTLIFNWYEESIKFTPDLKVLVIDGNTDEREKKIEESMKYNIVITSYPLLYRDIQCYADKEFRFCILDEAQHIKNPATDRAKAVKAIHSKSRFALTGTPLENNISDLWSIFDFAMSGFLGSMTAFSDIYQSSPQVLKKRIKPFIMRRTKKEALPELPDKIEQVHSASMSEKQLALYLSILEAVRKNVFDTIDKKGFQNSHIEILAALTKLRQVCNHPGLVDSSYMAQEGVSNKLELFEEIIEDCIGENHKILVFSQFTRMLGILAHSLENMNLRFSYLDGKTNNRGTIVKEFNENPDITIFLISIKAGGYGLNLTSADTVIIYDPWWNPMVENQAIDRTHRIGQKKAVNVYRLITRESIEEKILKLQKKKRELFENLIEGSNNPLSQLTQEDIRYILN